MQYKESPKTDSGRRTVPIFKKFQPLMKAHLEKYAGEEWLTTTSTGEMVLDTSYRSILDRAKEAAGHKGAELTSRQGVADWLWRSKGCLPLPSEIRQRDLRTILGSTCAPRTRRRQTSSTSWGDAVSLSATERMATGWFHSSITLSGRSSPSLRSGVPRRVSAGCGGHD